MKNQSKFEAQPKSLKTSKKKKKKRIRSGFTLGLEPNCCYAIPSVCSLSILSNKTANTQLIYPAVKWRQPWCVRAAAAAPHRKKKKTWRQLHTAYITKAAAVWPDNRDDNLFFFFFGRERKEPMDKHAKCGGWLLAAAVCLFLSPRVRRRSCSPILRNGSSRPQCVCSFSLPK